MTIFELWLVLVFSHGGFKAVVCIGKIKAAAVKSCNAFDNRQPEAAAGFFLPGRSEKAFAQPRQYRLVDDGSGVDDRNLFIVNRCGNLCSVRAVFDGIVEQVAQQQSGKNVVSSHNR